MEYSGRKNTNGILKLLLMAWMLIIKMENLKQDLNIDKRRLSNA